MNNVLERVRIKTGLTRPQFEDEIFVDGEWVSIRLVEDLERDYDEWFRVTLSEIDRFDGEILTATEVANITGLSEFNVSRLRERGQIGGFKIGVNRYGYPKSEVRHLVESNSSVLSGPRRVRGPLANAFLSWRRLKSA